MNKTLLTSDQAPAAIGPYSQAVRSGDLLFCSGQLPLDPADPAAAFPDDITAQTQRVLLNLKGMLTSQGLTLQHVLKTTVFLTDMADFAAMNAVYATFFDTDPPARSTVAVKALPRAARVEIEFIATFV